MKIVDRNFSSEKRALNGCQNELTPSLRKYRGENLANKTLGMKQPTYKFLAIWRSPSGWDALNFVRTRVCCQLASEWLRNVGRESRVSQNLVKLGSDRSLDGCLQEAFLYFMGMKGKRHKTFSNSIVFKCKRSSKLEGDWERYYLEKYFIKFLISDLTVRKWCIFSSKTKWFLHLFVYLPNSVIVPVMVKCFLF